MSKERDTDDHVAWLLDREEFEVTIQTYFHRYIYVLFIIYERSGVFNDILTLQINGERRIKQAKDLDYNDI